jgi:two-component system response regulator YesN
MYTVMLVDDDVPVLEFLQQMIPWHSLGLEVTGSYTNGKDALAAALQDTPDIVITDIGMPQMSGIELIAEFKARELNIKSVIISCHHEFEYARQAVKLEVIDYILKESLQLESILACLGRTIERISSDRESRRQLDKWKHVHERSAPIRKQRLLSELLEGPLPDAAGWTEQARDLGLDTAQPYVPVLCCPVYVEGIRRYGSKEMFHFAVENIAAELLHGRGMMFPQDSFLVILLPAVPDRPAREQLDVEKRISGVQQAVSKYLKVDSTMLAGNCARGAEELQEELQLLAGKLQHRFYLKHGTIAWDIPDQPFSGKDLFADYTSAVDEFRLLVLEEGADRVTMVIRRWFDRIIRERYEPGMVKEWTLKMMIDLQMKLKSLTYFQTDFSQEVLHGRMAFVESVYELEEWLRSFLHEAIATMDEIFSGPQKREVMEAVLYIESRLHKRVAMEEVAEQLHLNPSYFSRLFKKETGEGFVEYVTRRKMERAKELLAQSGSTVDEVAYAIGYDNKNYFAKVFKQHTGITPGEYARKDR